MRIVSSQKESQSRKIGILTIKNNKKVYETPTIEGKVTIADTYYISHTKKIPSYCLEFLSENTRSIVFR